MLRTTKLHNKLAAAGLVWAFAVLGVLSLSAPASAMLSLPFDGQIAPAGGSFGSIEAGSIAVNDFNGETYVADSGTGVVDVFDTSSGAQLASLDGSLTPAGSFGGGAIAVAVNDGTGEIYVLDGTHKVVDAFDSSGNYLARITASAAPAGGFLAPRSIAIDQATGELYVLDVSPGVVDVFSASGTYLREIALSSIPGVYVPGIGSIAVNDFNDDLYVGLRGGAEGEGLGVAVFDATGSYLTTWTGSGTPAGAFGSGELSVAADDGNGDVYVTNACPSCNPTTDVLAASGVYLAQISHSFDAPRDTAVDQASGKVYIADDGGEQRPSVVEIFGPGIVIPDTQTAAATDVQAHSATLNGTVGPDETQLSDCRFEYGLDASYGHNAPCVPAAGSIPSDSAQHQVSAEITGLQAGATYHFRLVAANAAGQSAGADETLSTLPGPAILGASARNLTGATAELTAEINPEGAATTYHFEYDTRPYTQGEAAHGKVPAGGEGSIVAGSEPELVGAMVTGLEASRTYYWRVVATNARETTIGVDHTFKYAASGSSLPDGRAYEIVTPPEKNGALVGSGVLILAPDISADGTRVMAASIQCFAGALSCTASRESEGEPYSFTRTAAGWQTITLAPAPLQANGNSFAEPNATTGAALFSMPTAPGGEDDFYVREADGSFVHIGPTTSPALGALGPIYLAAGVATTPDFSHVAYQLDTGELWPFDGTKGISAYELSGVNDQTPSLIGVSGGAGSTALISICGAPLAGAHAMSADGSTIYFTAAGHRENPTGCPANDNAPEADELYARIDGSRTVGISQRSPLDCTTVACEGSLSGGAHYEDSSADGSQVFFTDTQQLTDAASEDENPNDRAATGERECSSTAGANGCNLYEYDFASPAGHNLVVVSAGDTSGLGPEVQRVMAVSSDGSHVYFVARGVLSAEANDQGARAIAGGENLYVYERDASYPEGRIAFVATLSSLDHEAANGLSRPDVTPDGDFLVFTSHADLTLDDDSSSGAAQLFRYDAASGQLVRISIGEQGFGDDGNTFERLCEVDECAQDAALAKNTSSARRDQTMSDDGAYVFFTSPVGLTAHALNDVQIATTEHDLPVFAQNVYEYHEGHVYLISDGKDTSRIGPVSGVTLLGSDTTGANVFFTTADRLVPQDTDSQRDIYDARICTAASPCVAPTAPLLPPCLGEACHGTPAASPARFAPASASFSGEGNLSLPQASKPRAAAPRGGGRLAKALRGCRARREKRKRASCEAQARKRYGVSSKHKQSRSKSRKGGK